ncbi:MAG: PilZ domain-containing protein [Acidobacteria bacterium]|nr:PilZ domain-containing protein [Acidobacteriota bacterium]MBI3662282.1 PilZ domain-containing protein [Acidobacteriota bacterium]
MSLYTGGERRRSGRIDAKRPVLITSLDAESLRPVTAFTFTLSQFGCAVRCLTSVAPGTRVLLECEGKKMPGKVTFVLKSSALEGYEIGIAFDSDGSEFWGETF